MNEKSGFSDTTSRLFGLSSDEKQEIIFLWEFVLSWDCQLLYEFCSSLQGRTDDARALQLRFGF